MTEPVSTAHGMAPGEIIVRTGDKIDRMFAVCAGDTTWVFHDGAVYQIDEAAPQRRGQRAQGSLASPMPATVLSVAVSPGDEVTAGQTLVVLEAMKMELPVRAPGDGRVIHVHCKPGDLVQPGVSLIDIE